MTEDFDGFRFNTAIAAMMEFTNFLQRVRGTSLAGSPLWGEATRTLVLLLAPICPHIAEEIWVEHLKQPYSVHQQAWPVFDATTASATQVTLVLQVNGRVRDRVEVPAGITEGEARDLALKNARVHQFIDGKSVTNVIVVPGKLVNVVVR